MDLAVARTFGTTRVLRLAAVVNVASYLLLAAVREPVAARVALALEAGSAVLWIVTEAFAGGRRHRAGEQHSGRGGRWR